MTEPEATIQEVYPYLRVDDAARAIDFYARAFGASESFRLTESSGRVGHAEVKLGAATLMLASEHPDATVRTPHALGGTTVAMHLHVANVDRFFATAVAAGATVIRPLADQFYGERSGTIRDPFGHEWIVGGHIEDVSTAEMQRRYREVTGDAMAGEPRR